MSNYSRIVSVDLSFEQLMDAVRRLPDREKITVWRLLDQEVDRKAIATRFSQAVEKIRTAYTDVTEKEVEADVLQAIQEVRTSRRNAQDSP